MTYFSINCAHCGNDFKAERKRKYCNDYCKGQAAYEKFKAKAPKCPICGGPHQVAGKSARPACNKCYKAGLIGTNEAGEAVCRDCGKVFSSERNKKRQRCSQCQFERQKASAAAKGPCSVEGCDTAQFCKGMCSPHYWANHLGGAPRAYPDIHKTCEFCGDTFTTKTQRTQHCSSTCGVRARHRANYLASLSDSTELVHVPAAPQPKPTWEGHEIPARKGLPLVSGPCGWCNEEFVGQPMTRYCSKRCSSNMGWKRQYDLRGDFTIAPKARMAIYERDSWTCQICYSPVPKDATHGDYEYATLDHIIPQSHQLIPDHSPSNLRLAHMWCNAKRGNRTEYDMTA